MIRITLVGGETLLGADLREIFATRLDRAKVKLAGSHDETVITEEEGEAVVMAGLDAGSFTDASVVVLAGTPDSSRKALALIEATTARRPPVIDVTGALEDRPEARLRAPLLDAGTPPSALQIVAHPAAVILAKVLRASKGAGRAVATILIPASDRGRAGINELSNQTAQLLSFKPLQQEVFGAQLAYNLLAGGQDATEKAIERHLASLLAAGPPAPMPSIRVIQASVMHGYSISLWVEGAGDFDREGLDLWPEDPPSIAGIAGEDGISIGAMARDRNHPTAIWMWVVADQFRISALNTLGLVRELL